LFHILSSSFQCDVPRQFPHTKAEDAGLTELNVLNTNWLFKSDELGTGEESASLYCYRGTNDDATQQLSSANLKQV
jgi:hypothetical protein